MYEKCLFNEMATQLDDILSKYQCGFRKGFSSQQCIIVLFPKWKKIETREAFLEPFYGSAVWIKLFAKNWKKLASDKLSV